MSSSSPFHTLQSLISTRNTHESQQYPIIFENYQIILKNGIAPAQIAPLPAATPSANTTEYLNHQIIQLQTKLRHISSHHLQLIREKSVFVDSLLEATNEVQELDRRRRQLEEALEKAHEELSISHKQHERLQHANASLLTEITRRDKELETMDATNEALQRQVLDLCERLDVMRMREEVGDVSTTPSTTPKSASSRHRRLGSLFSSGNGGGGGGAEESYLLGALQGGSPLSSSSSSTSKDKQNTRRQQSTTAEDTKPMDTFSSLESSESSSTTSILLTQIYTRFFTARTQPFIAATYTSEDQNYMHCFRLSDAPSTQTLGALPSPIILPTCTERIHCAHFLENFIQSTNRIHSSYTTPESKFLLAYSGGDSVIHLASLQAHLSDTTTSPKSIPTAHLRGHTAQVNTLTDCLFSTVLLSGSQDKTIKLWDTSTQKLTKTYSCGSSCLKLASVPLHVNPALFASIHFDQCLRFFDIRVQGDASSMCALQYQYGGRSKQSVFRLLDLQCAERYCVVSTSEGKVDVFDVRSLAQGALRTLDLGTVHSLHDEQQDIPQPMRLQLSPCLNYIACLTRDAVFVYDLTQGEFVDEMRVNEGELCDFLWPVWDKKVHLMRSDANVIEVRSVL